MSCSHLNKLRKAYLMRIRKISYEKEKIHSIKIAHGEEVEEIGCWEKCINSLSRKKLLVYVAKRWRKLDGQRRSVCFFVIGILFFLFGVLLAYLFFALLFFQFHLSIHHTTLICLLLGLFLSLGLAFNSGIRCFVCLLFPQLCSKQGRTAMIAYAYLLILTGPTLNTLRNIGKVAGALLCNEKLLKARYEQIKQSIKAPFIAFKKEVQRIVQIIKDQVKALLEPLEELTKVVMTIAASREPYSSTTEAVTLTRCVVPKESLETRKCPVF